MITKVKDSTTTLIQQYQKSELAKADSEKPVGPPAGVSETVNLSSKAKDIQRIKQMLDQLPDVRENKIAELKQKIESGAYRVDAAKIAEKMVTESLIDLFA